ncbi:MAG: EutN/CcmL family microcompartment protein [Kiritimatiellae bacterium]|nr:EutN/CcmL family microcompartment protein [Kiritimatiellia bacterium]
MILGRVLGTVVASRKSPRLEGGKFLLVEKIDPATMKGKKEYIVAIDGAGAGIHEIVFYATGSCGRYTDATEGKPSDATITAIVDAIEIDGDYVYNKATDA